MTFNQKMKLQMQKVSNFFKLSWAVLKYKFKKCNCKRRRKNSQGEDQEPASEIELFFQISCKQVKKLKNVPPEIQLQLYGLFKQQKEGNNTLEDTKDLDYIEKQKDASWKSCKGMSQEDAQLEYVQLVVMLSPELKQKLKEYAENQGYNPDQEEEGDEDEDRGPATTFGLQPSVMLEEEEYENNELENQEELSEQQQQIFDLIEDDNLQQLQNISKEQLNFKMRNQQGVSILHSAIDMGSLEISQYLVDVCKENQIDINIKDIEGQIPLHYAIFQENDDILELLLQNGADPNLKDASDQSPLDFANQSQKQFISEFNKNK